MNKSLDHRSIRSNFFHCLNIKLVMRGMIFPIWMYITLLPDNNLIDKSGSIVGPWRDPNFIHTSKLPLKFLKEEHKVPDSEDMSLHGHLDILLPSDSLVYFMAS